MRWVSWSPYVLEPRAALQRRRERQRLLESPRHKSGRGNRFRHPIERGTHRRRGRDLSPWVPDEPRRHRLEAIGRLILPLIGGTIAAEMWLPVLRETGFRMGDADSDALEAVPREFAVKSEPSREATPKALLTKALQRLYQPLSGASRSASVSC